MGTAIRRIWTAVLACTLSAVACAGNLRIVTEHGPPNNMRVGGQIVGISTDKVREAMKRAGLGYTIELMPWKLAYSLAQQEPATCIYSTARNSEREAKFKWVGPIYDVDWTLFARADRHLLLTSIDDAKQMRIGTYKGDVPEEYLRKRGFQVDAAAEGSLNPGKLLAGRIDLWVTSRSGALQLLNKNGWADKIVPVLTFNQSEVYLACNPAVSDELVAKLNAALQSMRTDGSFEAIDRKYANWQGTLK